MRPTTLRLVLLALPLVAAPVAAIELGDFDRRAVRASLFQLDDAPAPRSARDIEREPPGEFALSFWGCPVTRFLGGPQAYTGGVGVSFDWRPYSFFGLSTCTSGWAGIVSYQPDERFGKGRHTESPVRILELSIAPRFHPIVWRNGSIYGEIRLVYSVADGPDPLLRTQSWGVDHYFGFEIGTRPVYFFGEFGFGARVALFRKDSGWIGTNETLNNDLGGFFELMRFGLRWYF